MADPCVMLVAAEASGDVLGAELAVALRARLDNKIRIVGIGGAHMADQGIASPFDISELGVIGIFDALRAYPAVLKLAARAASFAETQKPRVAVLIDSWGFNLRVAHRLKRLHPRPRLIKYVAPQVWATRPGRARTLARSVDELLTIHSFDARFFEKEGLPVTFVGNPALRRRTPDVDTDQLRRVLGASSDDPILLLLPGSRKGEIERLLPPFEDAVDRLRQEWPALHVVAAPAVSVAKGVKERLLKWKQPVHLLEGDLERHMGMQAATVALACSGTVTTELAMVGCPMVVAYRLGPFTAAIARTLIRTRFITLFNVAAGEFVAPERLQEKCTGDVLATDIAALLRDPEKRKRQVAAQFKALDVMRGGIDDPIAAAADEIVRVLQEMERGGW